MKTPKKISVLSVSAAVLAFSLTGSIAALAATTPSLGTASTFSILSSTYTNTALGTVVDGDLGYTTGPALAPTVNGTTFVADGTFNQAGISQNTALSALASQPCTFNFAPGSIDLATDPTHGPIGVYTPGVYCTSGAASVGTGGITLSGTGTYIFRIDGALNTVANSVVTLAGGSSSCNVFWTPTAATTLGANSTFVGTDLDAAGITIGSTVTWTGRALAFGGTVSTDVDTITVRSCSAVTPATSSATSPSSFSSSVSPSSSSSSSNNSTSSDIKVKKDADKSTLHSGPAKVTFTYRVTNEGDVALSDVSLKDDKCDDVDFTKGDGNNNNLLDTNEEWRYRCKKTVSKTETNIATARGTANGKEVKGTADFKVTVSTPSLPNAGVGSDENLMSPWQIFFQQLSSLFNSRSN